MALKGNHSFPVFHSDLYSVDKSGWMALDLIWTKVTGYNTQQFEFTSGSTPIATFKETSSLLVLYYVTILGGREIMRSFPAFKLQKATLIHNFALSFLSAVLLFLFLEQLLPNLWARGTYYCVCEQGGWSKELETLYYLNYLTKYVELIDTVFLVLKKKPLTFLHCYHHGATALLCYTQLVGRTSVSWVPITLNLAVHVIMYWYYFQTARGVRVWWKAWITRLQILQFVIDLGFIYFASWNYFASHHAPELPHFGYCAGEDVAAFTGCAILSSYLVLFISFYLATYVKSPKSSRDAKNTALKKEKMWHSSGVRAISDTTTRAGDILQTADDAFKSVHGSVAGD